MRALTVGVSLTVAVLASGGAFAQAWPTKPIRYIVPFTPAGATDITARIIADKIAGPLGQPVVVENRPGAAGNVGTEVVSKSAPDGYTVLQCTVAQSISQTLYKKLSYDLEKDLVPVAMIALVPNVMEVNPSVPAKSVAEFIALAKSRPGKINFASSGSGTSIHMSAEMFMMITGVKMVHVPYKGSGPALAGMLGGEVDVMFDNLTSSIGYIKSGRLRALAITSATRYPELPDLPTMQEAGVPGYEATAWFGMLMPKGTPKSVVTHMNRVVNKALAEPDVKDKLAQQGAVASAWTPEQFGEFIHNEIAKWGKVVKASGATVE
jgi:tripartite-type tricarboxylate transporter receptor subunit TctC